MTDWSREMEQTFEYYTVDAGTWKDVRKLDTVTSCSLSFDSTDKYIATASLGIDEDLGERYVRAYLITKQDGVREKHPLLCFLTQWTGNTFDGTHTSSSVDCYAPLYELAEKQPALGYFIEEGKDIPTAAYMTARENMRAPVVRPSEGESLSAAFVANSGDTWLTFEQDLLSTSNLHFAYDEQTRILFEPDKKLSAMSPVTTYTDNNSSILLPSCTQEKDLYNIPNVVEVVYSDGTRIYYGKAVNDDPNSAVSTVHRGREIPVVITDPVFSGIPTESMVQDYAKDELAKRSTLIVKVTYKHGFNDVRLGDAVLINNTRAGITNTIARVTAQSFECKAGIEVTETAEYEQKYWG